MTGKISPRVGEARDTAVSHYVFEAPVRLWHWLTVGCMLVLMVTGYLIWPTTAVGQRRGHLPVLTWATSG